MCTRKTIQRKWMTILLLLLLFGAYNCPSNDEPPVKSSDMCDLKATLSGCFEFIGDTAKANAALVCAIAGSTVQTDTNCSATNCIGKCAVRVGTPDETAVFYYSTGSFPYNNATATADCAAQDSGAGGTFSATCN